MRRDVSIDGLGPEERVECTLTLENRCMDSMEFRMEFRTRSFRTVWSFVLDLSSETSGTTHSVMSP